MVRVVAMAAILLLTVAPGSADAARHDQGPPDQSAIDQYVEVIPTSTGGRTVRVGATSLPIPQAVARGIARSGGGDAATLRAIVSNPAYGAGRPHPTRKGGTTQPAPATSPRSQPTVGPATGGADPSLAAAAFSSMGAGTTAWLIAGLVAITLIALAARLARRR